MPARKVTTIVPDPSRVRRITTSFAWLDHRLLGEGHLERLTPAEIALYVFLALAADRTGVSFYRRDVMARKLGLGELQIEEARRRLLDRGLIAFRPYSPRSLDGFHQVLPVPAPVAP